MASFTIDRTTPLITVNSREGFLDDGSVTSDPYITIFSVDGEGGVGVGAASVGAAATSGTTASGLREIKVFKGTENNDLILFRESTSPLLPEEPYPANSWYYVRSCDKADNCGLSLFGIFEPGKDPPLPPGAPPMPPGSPPYTPPGGTPKKPRPFPDQPPCLLAGVDLSAGLQNCLPSFLPGLPPPFAVAPGYGIPKDPNAKHGTSGSVVAGQLMSYTIEFENEGTGKALGVYIKDTLDPSLDDTTLVLRDFQAVDYANNTAVPASFPWSYDDKTRTVTVLAGEAGPKKGGRFTLEARLRLDAALLSTPGTYALEARYAGDGFYYAPSSTRLDFLIEKRGALIGRPQAQGSFGHYTESLQISCSDFLGRSLT